MKEETLHEIDETFLKRLGLSATLDRYRAIAEEEIASARSSAA